jgi:hypothetical protein
MYAVARALLLSFEQAAAFGAVLNAKGNPRHWEMD